MKRTLIAFALFFCACDQGTAPPLPDRGYLVSSANADSLRFTFTGYDRVSITHQSGSSLRSSEFERVAVGTPDSTGFRQLASSGSTYDPSADLFSFDLDFTLQLNPQTTASALVIRFFRRGSGFTDIDTTVLQYKYPYANTEIFVTNAIMIHPGHFQDIDFLNGKLYFHPVGGEGLFEYDPVTRRTRELLLYGAGDVIAADSIYVFCDVNHRSIWRYNLPAGRLVELLTYSPILNYDVSIMGMETYNGLLYVVEHREYTNLHTYTYDGVQVDSVWFPFWTYRLTISDGILYLGQADTIIERYSLPALAKLPSITSPARDIEGIRIYNGRMYYCDYSKSLIGSVPVQDLR